MGLMADKNPAEVDAPPGERLLVKYTPARRGYSTEDIEEVTILEWSPSGDWVKFQNAYGAKFWRSRSAIRVVEPLRRLKRPDVDG